MFGRRFDLFRLLGFTVRVDLSWFVVLVLVSWSLAEGVFPASVEGLPSWGYWTMGIIGALGLFGSVVLHELAHSLEARRHGLEMKGITLFIFGGVAEMTEEPPSPKAEFDVAIAGPILSLLLGLILLGAQLFGRAFEWSEAVVGVVGYLGLMNLVLVAFNVVPAFPLDGGRVLRSILWRSKCSLRQATRITSRIGSFFGLALIAMGIVAVFYGDFLGGMWWFLIGLFLRSAAQMSYQQLLVRRLLEGEPVSRFMRREPITVPRSVTVRELVENYLYRYHHKMFPVTDNGHVVGCISTDEVTKLPREEWERWSVGALADACDEENSVSPETDAMEALSQMQRSGSHRLLVVDEERLAGVLTLRDLMAFFALKVELQDL